MAIMKDSYVIKPSEGTPMEKMGLSDFDLIIPTKHALTVYFYKPPVDFPNAVHIIKDSLSKALVTFYPLAGRLQPIHGGRVELDCNAMGALLLVAESKYKMEDFGDFSPTPQLQTLIPSVDYNTPIHQLPLLLVQLTQLSCGGISLGLAISFTVADGRSAMHFVAEWAKVARNCQSQCSPFFDRTILRVAEPWNPLSFDHLEFSPPPLLIGCSDTLEEKSRETTVALLKLNKEEIEKLKDKANEGQSNGNSGRPYTRYEVVAGHMWRSACKARQHKIQQPTTLYIAADARNRMEPPLPDHYFGNAVCRVAASATSGELMSKPLCYAASKIRSATQKATNEYVRSSLHFLRSHEDLSHIRIGNSSAQGNFQWNPNMCITSLVGLPLYGVDFGWGKEVYMGLGAILPEGKSFILSGGDDDGSFVIALSLQVAHMEAFKNTFYGEI